MRSSEQYWDSIKRECELFDASEWDPNLRRNQEDIEILEKEVDSE